jgi:hypothetical protein
MPGTGTWLTANVFGHSISDGRGRQTFNHPFRPALGGNSMTLRIGLVSSMNGDGPLQPAIKVGGELVPMAGADFNTPARLALDPGVQNKDGVSWAILQVVPDADGELRKTSRIEIVHGTETTSHALALAVCPLVQIIWKGQSALRTIPIVHFNLRYTRLVPTPGGGVPKHFFL